MSTPDQIAVAKLHGRAQRYVFEKVPVDEAVAGLREVTTRGDLLAETAGILVGAADPKPPDREFRVKAARLLVQAGADRELLPKWIAEGRQRAARPSPFAMPQVWPDDLDGLLADVLAGLDR